MENTIWERLLKIQEQLDAVLTVRENCGDGLSLYLRIGNENDLPVHKGPEQECKGCAQMQKYRWYRAHIPEGEAPEVTLEKIKGLLAEAEADQTSDK